MGMKVERLEKESEPSAQATYYAVATHWVDNLNGRLLALTSKLEFDNLCRILAVDDGTAEVVILRGWHGERVEALLPSGDFAAATRAGAILPNGLRLLEDR